jgi:hypothetical protein
MIRSWGVFDAGTETVKGVATIDTRSTTGTLSNRAGAFGVEAANHFSLPVDVAENVANGLSNTVLAITNVNNSSDLILYLQLFSENGIGSPSETGVSINATAIGLLPGRQITTSVTEIWPQLKVVGFRGTVVIGVVSGQANSLVVTALSLKDGLFSPVPAISAFVNSCRGCWDY